MTREFVSVLEADASFRLVENAGIKLIQNGTDASIDFGISTQYRDIGIGDRVPDRLVVQAEMRTDRDGVLLEDAGRSCTETARMLVHILAVAANAVVMPADPLYVAEVTPGVAPRRVFQAQSKIATRTAPVQSRLLEYESSVELVCRVMEAPDADRQCLTRAVEHYILALHDLNPDTSTLAMMQLFIAAENLKHVALKRSGLSLEELAERQRQAMKLKPFKDKVDVNRAAENYARHHAVFHGDVETHRKAVYVSDGMEHGIRDLEEINEAAEHYAYRAADHVRRAVIELSGLSPEGTAMLLDERFARPISRYPTLHAFSSFRDAVTPETRWQLPFDFRELAASRAELDESTGKITISYESTAFVRAPLTGETVIRANF